MDVRYQLLGLETPIIFADGSSVYQKLANVYAIHSRGYFVLAPSGSGKTHFVKGQKDKNWIDGDDLWQTTLALPEGPWWKEPLDRRVELEARCDVITQEARRLGFWVVGGSNTWLKPDAVVIPNWNQHKHHISLRDRGKYDGGLTTDQLESVRVQRTWFGRWIRQGVSKFGSVEDAAEYLAKLP